MNEAEIRSIVRDELSKIEAERAAADKPWDFIPTGDAPETTISVEGSREEAMAVTCAFCGTSLTRKCAVISTDAPPKDIETCNCGRLKWEANA